LSIVEKSAVRGVLLCSSSPSRPRGGYLARRGGQSDDLALRSSCWAGVVKLRWRSGPKLTTSGMVWVATTSASWPGHRD